MQARMTLRGGVQTDRLESTNPGSSCRRGMGTSRLQSLLPYARHRVGAHLARGD